MGTTISGDTGVVFPDATTQSTAVTVATPFSINASAGAGAQLRLPEATANGVNYVAVKAADNLAVNTTWTLPTADGTNGQYLRTDGAGNLSFATVPVTSPGGTTGQIQINNAGAFGAISSGTSGQYLTSGGAGVAPSWTTVTIPPVSGIVFISTQTATTGQANVDFTQLSGYSRYLVVYNNVTFAASLAYFQALFGTGGASPTYITSSYNGSAVGWGTNTSTQNGSNFFSFAQLNYWTAATGGTWSGYVFFHGIGTTVGSGESFVAAAQTASMSIGTFGHPNTSNPITAIRLTSNSQFNSGSFTLYGLS